jgi:putative ABC transport system permease protein
MRQSLRGLARDPGFSLSAVAVLAFGFFVCILVLSIAHALLLDPVAFRDPDTLVQLRESDAHGGFAPLSAAGFRQAQARKDLVEAPAAVDMGMFTLTGIEQPEQFAGAAITPGAIETLGVQLVLGHPLRASDPNEVLLSYAAWSHRFGADPQIVGKVIRLDWARTPQVERYRVAGVLPRKFWLFYRGLEVFVPLTDELLERYGRVQRYYSFGRRAAAAPPVWSTPLGSSDWSLAASPLTRDLTEDIRPTILLLSAVAILLALLTSANAANLFLVRGLRRRQEFRIRMALGASRWAMARIVLAETLIVSLCAVGIAFPAASSILSLLRRWFPADLGWIQFTPGIDGLAVNGWVLGPVLVAAFLTSLLVASLPAWQSASAPLGLHGSTARQPYRSLLIGFQVGLATVLVCGAGLLLKSLARLDQADLGFAREHMLVVRVPRVESGPDSLYYADLRRRVESLPGVEAVSFASFQPLTNTSPRQSFSIPGGQEDTAAYCVVAADFFEVYGVPLYEGRAFGDADGPGSPPVAIINQSLAKKHWPGRSALGARIQLGASGPLLEIVGVAADVRQSLAAAAPPMIYRPAAQEPAAGLQMGVRTRADPLALAPAIRREIGLAGGAAAELNTLQEFVFSESWRTQISALLTTGFSMLALAVAVFGIYAVVSYTVRHRRREIGIRAALGADRNDLILLFVAEGMRPVTAGLLAGLASAFAVGGYLRGLLFEMQPDDPASFIAAALVILAATLCAIAIPARRGANAEPAESLREP